MVGGDKILWQIKKDGYSIMFANLKWPWRHYNERLRRIDIQGEAFH